ncbi:MULTISPECIES: hypothetical protein [unclassified Bacillus (in: firmicutes)]|nr:MULTISPECIES: hypothetical protein [unclassified Bacillus (in: firmicutes)]
MDKLRIESVDGRLYRFEKRNFEINIEYLLANVLIEWIALKLAEVEK